MAYRWHHPEQEKDGFDANNITINTHSKWDEVEIRSTLIRRTSDSDLDAMVGVATLI